MDDLTSFMTENQPRGKKSKLAIYEKEIMALKENGYSEKDILRFLEEKKGCLTTQPTLNRFINSHLNKDKKVGTAATFSKSGQAKPSKPVSPAEEADETDSKNNTAFVRSDQFSFLPQIDPKTLKSS